MIEILTKALGITAMTLAGVLFAVLFIIIGIFQLLLMLFI